MAKVNKESLAKVIRQLEEWESERVLTLKEEFQLAAYRKLMEYFDECHHTYGLIHGHSFCHRCGDKLDE